MSDLSDPDPRYPELRSLIASALATDDLAYATSLPRLYLGRWSSPAQLHAAQWPSIAVVVQGEKSITVGDREYAYGVGQCLVVSLDVPVTSRVQVASPDQPYLGLALSIDCEQLSEVMTGWAAAPQAEPSVARLGVSVAPATSDLLDAMLRLMRLLDRPEDVPVMAPLIEREILYRVLVSAAGANLRRVARAGSHSNRIANAARWLRQNFASPMRVEVLARQVGMSVSSFHQHFSAMTTMTPLQYQKRLRLTEARRLLLIEGLDVSAACYQVGYESASQFSREYARLFGLSPSRDVEKMRNG